MTYSVDLASGLTESFFDHLKQLSGQNHVTGKRLTDITIELMQNITRHSASSAGSSLVIEKHKHEYRIIANNLAKPSDADALTEKIAYLNSLNYSQLKKVYTLTLQKSTGMKSIGAGLGLCRIALRSKNTLQVSLVPQSHCFRCTLHVTLPA